MVYIYRINNNMTAKNLTNERNENKMFTCKLPLEQYSVRIHTLLASGQTPKSLVIFWQLISLIYNSISKNSLIKVKKETSLSLSLSLSLSERACCTCVLCVRRCVHACVCDKGL